MRRWSVLGTALLGGAVGMLYAAWPTLWHHLPIHYDQLLLCAAVGAAVFAIVAVARNAFAS